MENRLTELLTAFEMDVRLRCPKYETPTCEGCKYDLDHECDKTAILTDYLLANGVIVPPVKLGQTCYKVWNGEILEIKVVSIMYEPLPAYSYAIRFNSLGVLCLLADGSRNEAYSWDCIFLTKEEAEKELERRKK